LYSQRSSTRKCPPILFWNIHDCRFDRLPIVARVDLPSSADWIAFGFGSVWVVNYRPDRVSRIDTVTNRVVADVPIGRNGCLGIVSTADRIWVPTCGDGVVNEIDPGSNTVVRRIPVPNEEGVKARSPLSTGVSGFPRTRVTRPPPQWSASMRARGESSIV
jgi:YVTN family beta-propeller protein